MDYNYYPAQSGHPPPPPHMQPGQQHGYSQVQLMPSANNMMMGPGPPPPQTMRQLLTPGASPGHQQMQPQQPPLPPPQQQQQQQQQPHPMMGQQHIQSPQQQQQQQHSVYHHQSPHSHPHALPHSSSPHPNQQQPSMNMNLQPPSRPSTGPSPHHPMHLQSPHLMGGPPPPPPPQMQQPPLNHVGGPLNVPPNINQPQPSMHPQNFMSPGPIPPPSHPSPHYNQPPSGPLPPPPTQQNHAVGPPNIHPHHHHHIPPQGPSLPPAPQAYPPHHMSQPALERGSPFYQNIPQTEFRIIELNKRLQNRPRPRGPAHPLPHSESAAESFWWDKFASDFFDHDATLTLRTFLDDKPVEYTIGRTLIPRYFRSYFEGGVVDFSIKLRSTKELHHNLITLDCDHTDITTKNVFIYQDVPMYVVVHTEGHLIIEFISTSFDTLLIKSWKFYTNQCREYIDRSMTTAPGLPEKLLMDPVTSYGLTKQTKSFLKMCMIMEPMQELMLHHKQTHMDPRSCLKQLFHDKYKLKTVEDNRAQPNRRRKRKTPAATGVTKKSKANANANSVMNSNNSTIGFNNMNSLMSPSTMHGTGATGIPVTGNGGVVPNLSLASQDVMVVGEPSLLGANFGDENERRITRLENNQFDSSLNSTNSSSNLNNSNNVGQQNLNQMCNNPSNQIPNHSNMNHMQTQQNNLDTGNIQMMNHMNSNNNGNMNNNNNNNNKTNDPNKPTNNTANSCLQSGSNHQQMNLITMNGNTNHMNHMMKQEIDLKQSTATTAAGDLEQAR